MSVLANQLAAEERDEVARAIRMLLRSPLMTAAGDPVGFELVRRRRDSLVRWFDYTLGWSLVVEARLGFARLAKVRAYGVGAAGPRPGVGARGGRVLDRRRLVVLCMVCAELPGLPMTTIGMLADRVVQAFRADPGLGGFDTSVAAHRRAFVDALLWLESCGALVREDGSTESFADSVDAKVLYRVSNDIVFRLLSAPVSASQVERAASGDGGLDFGGFVSGLTVERRYGDVAGAGSSDTQRTLWLRHSVLRRLFDDAVVYRGELSEPEVGYLTSITGRQILRRACEQAGFVLEERAEGWMLVDASGLSSAERFPDGANNAKTAALLLLDAVAAAGAMSSSDLVKHAEGLLDRFPQWAKTYRSDDGAARLVEDGVRVLEDFGLVCREVDGDRVVVLPAAARYRLGQVEEGAARAGGDGSGSDMGSEQLELGV